MNEYTYRSAIVKAFGGTGPIGNEKQFWSTLISAVSGTPTVINTEREFWQKFAEAVTTYIPNLPDDEAIVEDGESIDIESADEVVIEGTLVVEGGTVSAIIPDTVAFVSNTDEVVIGGNTYTFTVVGGEITNIVVTP